MNVLSEAAYAAKLVLCAAAGILVAAALAVPVRAATEPSVEARADACDAEPGETPSPVSLYGPAIEFEVLRNDKPVGRHVTRFDAGGATVTVTSEMTLEVDFLFFTAYRFSYFSEDRWCGDRLWTLSARRDDNGNVTEVRAYHDGESVVVDSEGRTVRAPADIIPTNHWYAGVVKRDAVLNTLTGGVNEVDIVARGRETVDTAAGPVEATRYAYTGELTTDVWYDDAGRWVKLRFDARDGSTITYRCVRCGQDASGDGRSAARSARAGGHIGKL